MNKIKSPLLVASLMFFIALTAVGCAQTSTTMGTSSTMGADTMETGMKSMPDDKMDQSMDKTMDEDTMDKGMEKPMDTMNADKMDQVMDTMK